MGLGTPGWIGSCVGLGGWVSNSGAKLDCLCSLCTSCCCLCRTGFWPSGGSLLGIGTQAQLCSCIFFLFVPNTPSCSLMGWGMGGCGSHPPPPKQSIHSLINFIKWFATGNMHFLPRGFPRPVVPSPAVTGERVWGGGGICPPTSARLLPSILLTTISAKGSTRPPPGLLPQPCPLSLGWLPASAAAPPTPTPPPCFKFCRYGSVQQPPPPKKAGRGGEIRVELGFPSLARGSSAPLASPLALLSAQETLPCPPLPHHGSILPLAPLQKQAQERGLSGGVSISGVHNWANGVKCKSLCGRWR